MRGLIELKIKSMRIPQIEVPFGYEDKKAKKLSFHPFMNIWKTK